MLRKNLGLLAFVLLAGCASDESRRFATWSTVRATRPLLVLTADAEGRVVKLPEPGTEGAIATRASLQRDAVHFRGRSAGTADLPASFD